MVIFMNKKDKTVIVVLIVLFLTLIYTLASTYAVIINVSKKEEINEIVNVITLRDLVTNDNGDFNNYYYDVKNELNISNEEMELLMESSYLNDNLQIVLKSIVDYKIDNNQGAKLSNDDIYNLIVEGVNATDTITSELKDKVIKKSNVYKNDISNYLYDIEVSLIR